MYVERKSLCWVIDSTKPKDLFNSTATPRKLAQACFRTDTPYPPATGWVAYGQGYSKSENPFQDGEVDCFHADPSDNDSPEAYGKEPTDRKRSSGITQSELVPILIFVVAVWVLLIVCRIFQARRRARLANASRNRRGLVEITIFEDEQRDRGRLNMTVPVVSRNDQEQRAPEQVAKEVRDVCLLLRNMCAWVIVCMCARLFLRLIVFMQVQRLLCMQALRHTHVHMQRKLLPKPSWYVCMCNTNHALCGENVCMYVYQRKA
jgi:hypothetical protein